MAGYDVLAIDPNAGTSTRIQVKSRWASNSDQGFVLKNADADFVVLVLLNRGKYNAGTIDASGKSTPEIYVFPMSVALAARRKDGWQKVMTKQISNREEFRDGWEQIRDHLRGRI